MSPAPSSIVLLLHLSRLEELAHWSQSTGSMQAGPLAAAPESERHSPSWHPQWVPAGILKMGPMTQTLRRAARSSRPPLNLPIQSREATASVQAQMPPHLPMQQDFQRAQKRRLRSDLRPHFHSAPAKQLPGDPCRRGCSKRSGFHSLQHPCAPKTHRYTTGTFPFLRLRSFDHLSVASTQSGPLFECPERSNCSRPC